LAQTVVGNLAGLSPLERSGLQKLYRYQTPPDRIVGDVLGRQMCAIAAQSRRQVGALIDRRGRVTHVIVGDDNKIELPDVGRLRTSKGRLRGVRLVHVHLKGEPLTDDDLTDLARLGLDMVVAITLDGDLPSHLHVGHIVPTNPGDVIRDVRPHEVLRPLPWPGHGFDARETIEDLEVQLARHRPAAALVDARERALLVHVGSHSQAEAEDQLDELAELARTARVEVLDRVIQRRSHVHPETVLGSGRLQQVVLEAMQLEAGLLIFDRELTPAQVRGLSKATDMKILDRTQLILDIFASRARSADGKIKVELAQLGYQLPRLSSRDDALSRLTGGIGGVGPGETKLEVDRRRCRDRIHKLKAQLKKMKGGRRTRRKRRNRAGIASVCLVGYTNAGKSSLLNALTKSDIFTENLLFATLDPTSRRLRLGSGLDVVATDTVGFIRDLPKELLGAFEATLEEAREADALLIVADASHPQLENQLCSVEKILDQHDLADLPRLLVLSKSDVVRDTATVREMCRQRNGILMSAHTRDNMSGLFTAIDEVIAKAREDKQAAAERAAEVARREKREAWSPLDG
jgi:GTPase